MTGAFAFTPAIWPPLAAAIFLAALGLYSWRRRSVAGAAPLAIGSLFGVLWLIGMALETAAVDPATKIAWRKFQVVWQLPAATSTACFALEYTRPGRWRTRRNVVLLFLPSILALLVVIFAGGRLLWRQIEVSPEGEWTRTFAWPGLLLAVYGIGLVAVNLVALLSLFIRSPQHRWATSFMLFGEIAARLLYVIGLFWPDRLTPFHPTIAAVVLAWTMYAIALFGFRIFDPLAAARQIVMRQMREGLIVFDPAWRIISVNPAAERILGAPQARLSGKHWQDALPLPGRALPALSLDGSPPTLDEIRLGEGEGARHYALDLSLLRDERGIDVGRLLLLLDTTEQRRAQAQAETQARALAVLTERERLARELHDSAGQVFAFVNTQGQATRRLLARGNVELADEYLARLVEVAQEADTDLRESILGLRVALRSQGLAQALSTYLAQYQKRYGVRAELAGEPFDAEALEPFVEVQLLRIVQEALANARKHSGARSVRVSLGRDATNLVALVEDDGCGFDADELRERGERVGLRVMRERAHDVGGAVTIRSTPGQGTTVAVTVPLCGAEPIRATTEGIDHARAAG
jgi:signal transduction histidine kinase